MNREERMKAMRAWRAYLLEKGYCGGEEKELLGIKVRTPKYVIIATTFLYSNVVLAMKARGFELRFAACHKTRRGMDAHFREAES